MFTVGLVWFTEWEDTNWTAEAGWMGKGDNLVDSQSWGL